MLQNPTYAGVYVWGSESVRMDYVDGKIVKKKVKIPDVKKAKVFIENNQKGYIELDTFEENLKMIRKNCLSLLPGEGVGSARAGLALLGGILRCGRCGRKLYVAYYGKSGSAARYICKGDYEL